MGCQQQNMSFVQGASKNEINEQSSISYPIVNNPDRMPFQQLPSIKNSDYLRETSWPPEKRLSICRGEMPDVVRDIFYLKQLGATLQQIVHLNKGKLSHM